MTASSEVERPPDAPSDESSDEAPGEAPSEHRAPEPSSGSRFTAVFMNPRYVVPALVTLGIVLLGLAYLAQAKTQGIISEGASQALQGWDMLHGNFLLHGWSLSDVSFYTTEIPEYAVVEAVRGLSGNTVANAAALSYFLQVVMAGFLAAAGRPASEAWVRTFIAVGIMLAPTLGPATALLMASPDHIGTHVPLLLIYLVIDRVRPRWWLPIVIVVLLTWAQVADALVLVEGALPIAAVSALRMYRRRGPWRGQLYDLSMLVAAGLSAGLAKVVLKVIMEAGGFYVRTPIAAFGSTGPDRLDVLDQDRERSARLRLRLLRPGARRDSPGRRHSLDRPGAGDLGAHLRCSGTSMSRTTRSRRCSRWRSWPCSLPTCSAPRRTPTRSSGCCRSGRYSPGGCWGARSSIAGCCRRLASPSSPSP